MTTVVYTCCVIYPTWHAVGTYICSVLLVLIVTLLLTLLDTAHKIPQQRQLPVDILLALQRNNYKTSSVDEIFFPFLDREKKMFLKIPIHART